MFHYPTTSLGQADPLAAYRAAQAARQAQGAPPAPGAPGISPPMALPPVQILAPPAPVPRWVVIGGAVLGVTVLGLVAYTLLGKKRRRK